MLRPWLSRLSVAALTALLLSHAAQASVFGFLGGDEAIDLAAQRANESLDKAKAAASALLAESNGDIKDRINQVDQIQKQAFDNITNLKNGTVADIVRILDDATQKANALEKVTFSDLNATIRTVECKGKVFAVEDIGNALGKFGRVLGFHEIIVTLPLVEHQSFGRTTDEHTFEIRQPFGQTYIEIRDYLLANVGRSTDANSAHQIVGTYEYIASLATSTTCFYQGATGIYDQEFSAYKDKAKKWRDLLPIEVTSNAK